MSRHVDGPHKHHRILAWKLVDEILSREIPAVVLRHHEVTEANMSPEEVALVIARANHVLRSLRADARDLWYEG